ncbi:MAG: hypothetical protein DMG86_22800 [Acidobacteria bacterium]|nr:MAG: hypothetical protein DMG86_22800 [Acidobacteriota bacterium]
MGEDVFVHFSAIQSGGFRNLQEGQGVQFDEGGNEISPTAALQRK